MKPSQTTAISYLSMCWNLPPSADRWIQHMQTLIRWGDKDPLPKGSDAFLRRLTNKYKHQIRHLKKVER